MFGNPDRRKTGGGGILGRQSTAITPTKRVTDFGVGSVRKSEARPSLSVGGAQPRPSLFQKGSSMIPPRDVKSIQQANVQKIYQFLVEHEGDEAPSEAVIRSPRGKNDFVLMFELLYQHLSKDYEFPQNVRVEEEVSPIFKALGYPFTLKNSYFQPMGCSHGWPHLLDALSWLVDLAKINHSVRANSQSILFGDFMDQAKVQEKILSYMWQTNTFRDFTLDRKVIEDKSHPFWAETKAQLRSHFESSSEYDDIMINAKNALEQLKFDCDEIESERGQEQHLQEEITKMKDDIRKAEEYLTSTHQVKGRKEEGLQKAREELEEKVEEMEKVQKAVNELKERIEKQKIEHGLSGKEVRQMNLENQKDVETVMEIQAELDKLSKETWVLKNDDSFREQKAKFIQLAENVTKLVSGLEIQMDIPAIKAPTDEIQLRECWDALLKQWLPEVNRQLHQKKLELENKQSRFVDEFAAAEERNQIEQEMLGEAKKKEMREERIRRDERDEWKESRQKLEKRYDEMENEMEVLKKKMQMDGSLDKEIEGEKAKMTKELDELKAKQAELESFILLKSEQIYLGIIDMEEDRTRANKEFNDINTCIESRCASY